MISWSGLASPGGSTAFHFHWTQRAELVNEPSFSAKFAAGSKKTSVLTSPDFLLTSAKISGVQNEAVSWPKFSATTSHFRLESAAMTFLDRKSTRLNSSH